MAKYDDYDWAELPAAVQAAGELLILNEHITALCTIYNIDHIFQIIIIYVFRILTHNI